MPLVIERAKNTNSTEESENMTETQSEQFEATCQWIADRIGCEATDAEVARFAVAVIGAFSDMVLEAGDAADFVRHVARRSS